MIDAANPGRARRPRPGALLDAPDRGMGLHIRIARSYRDIRAVVRDLLAERPSEARLLFFVLLSDVIFFLSWTLSLVVAPGAETRAQLPVEIAAMLVLIFLCRTAALYVFSALVGILCRMAGGRGSWRATRTGVFWASLAAAPVGVLGAVIGALVQHATAGTGTIDGGTILLLRFCVGFMVFLYFLSAAVAEAQGFSRTSPVFAAFSAAAIGAIAALISISGTA